MSSPTLRQIFKFTKHIEHAIFAPDDASIAFWVEDALMVFYKHSSGLFVPSRLKNGLDGNLRGENVKWISPHVIQYGPLKLEWDLRKHRETFLKAFENEIERNKNIVPANHTICDHWMRIWKCEPCGKKEAQYHEHEAKTTIREIKDSSEKSMAKILDQGFVTIWSCGNETSSQNQETPTKKRGHESDPEQNNTGKAKQVKVESSTDVKSDSSVPASPEVRVLEEIRESNEDIRESTETLTIANEGIMV